MLRQKVRRGSEYLSEGIRRIRRGLPEEEPSATAERIASREIGRVAKKRVTFRRAAKGYRDYRVISLGGGMSAPYTRKKPLAPNCGASSVHSAADFATGR